MHRVLAVTHDEGARAELAAILSSLGHVLLDEPVAVDVIVADLLPDGRVPDALAAAVVGIDAPLVFMARALDATTLDTAAAHNAGIVLRPLVAREVCSALAIAAWRAGDGRKLALRERWYQTTLRSIGDAVITADEGSLIAFINPTAQALTGWSEADAIGQPLDAVFAVENDEAGVDPQGEPGPPVLRLRRKDGTTCNIEHNAAPIVEANGALQGIVVVFRDITEKRRIEQRLALSGRMTSIGTLAAGIAHELNNPLAFVTSNLDFVIGELDALQADPRASFAADLIDDSLSALREAADGAARAAQIVKDMKVFVRGDADPRIAVDVNRALSFAARLTNSEVRHVGDLQLELEDVPPTLADEGKLVQVFVNVLTNAAQALDPTKDERKIHVRSSLEGGRVVVRVSDTGKGIAAEHLGRVFEPFFTTKPVGQGLGLGLSISHTIVASFGGTITLESDPGRGTVVTICLPTSEEQRVVGARPHATGMQPRVLVVDDEALIGTAVRRILTRHGFDVVVESDSKKAYDAVLAGARYDVIVCDLMMPAFSGVDFHEGLGTFAPEQQSRMILMTGNAFTPRANELFETTKNVRLDKPFLPNDLVTAVNEVLRRHAR